MALVMFKSTSLSLPYETSSSSVKRALTGIVCSGAYIAKQRQKINITSPFQKKVKSLTWSVKNFAWEEA